MQRRSAGKHEEHLREGGGGDVDKALGETCPVIISVSPECAAYVNNERLDKFPEEAFQNHWGNNKVAGVKDL